MATTRDYLEYLNDQIDIAPANSQEELEAAELLEGLMAQHGLETRIQEFEAPTAGELPYGILMILLFVGVILAGFYGTPVAAAGVVVAFICGALFLLKRLGYDLLSNLGHARSQNVIGVHRAEGPLVMKGNRPIVIIAHYDTGRESLLYSRAPRFIPLLRRMVPVCVGVACVLGIAQLFGFVPEVARRVLWGLGILAALPPVVLGVDTIYQRFSSYTEGANDNKASVAAMLGVLDKVRPGNDAAAGCGDSLAERRAAEQEARRAAEAAEADEAFDEEFDEEYAEGVDEMDLDEPEGLEFDEDAAFETVEDEGVKAAPVAPVVAVANVEPEAVEDASYDQIEPIEDADAPLDASYDAYDEQVEPNDEEPLVADGELTPEEQAEEALWSSESQNAADYEAEDAYENVEFDEVAEDEEAAWSEAADEGEEPEANDDDYAAAERPGLVGMLLGQTFFDEIAEYEVIDEPEFAAEEDFSAEADEAYAWQAGETPLDEPFDVEIDDEWPDVRAYDEQPEAYEAVAEGAPVETPDVVQPTAEAADTPFVPSFARVQAPRAQQLAYVPAPEPEPEPEPEIEPQIVTDRYEEVIGVRHGKAVVEALRMLPVSCELQYVEPRLVERTVRPKNDYDDFGVISAPSDDWGSYERPDRRSRRSRRNEQEPKQSIFAKIGGFFSNLREQFTGDASARDDESYDAAFDVDQDFSQDAYDVQPVAETGKEEFPPYSDAAYDDAEYEDEVYVETLEDIELDESYEHKFDDPYEQPYEQPYEESAACVEELEADYDDELDAYAEEPQSVAEPEPAAYDSALEGTGNLAALTLEPQPVAQDYSVLAPGLAFEDEPLPTEEEIDLMDGSGLTQMVNDDLDATNPQMFTPAPKAEEVDDPNWGKSEYQPAARSVARRAALFDLPDPTARSVDPFDEQQGGSAGSDGHWKGGATTRSGLRDDEVDAPAEVESLDEFSELEVPTLDAEVQDELRDAILSMGDDALIAHDVWFVALGASGLDHAGMKAFLRENRSKIRGAFMVNLDSIGAGELNMLTAEGRIETRKTDRRVMRMLTTIAEDLHVPVRRSDYSWSETDATPAMRKSVRALTIMGMEDNVAALSHTADDVIDMVDPSQISAVSAMICELIRRA